MEINYQTVVLTLSTLTILDSIDWVHKGVHKEEFEYSFSRQITQIAVIEQQVLSYI